MSSERADSRSLIEYYDRRAAEYDRIYERDDPERQKELAGLKVQLEAIVRGRDVLEIACGTGYWTEIMSKAAKSITAVDASGEVLQVARRREFGCRVSLIRGDVYSLPFRDTNFNCYVAGFWLSHVPRSMLENHIHSLVQRMQPGDFGLFFDNVYREESGELIKKDHRSRDRYKLRKLDDGSEHLILKNYCTPEQLSSITRKAGLDTSEVKIVFGDYYWRVMIMATKQRLGEVRI